MAACETQLNQDKIKDSMQNRSIVDNIFNDEEMLAAAPRLNLSGGGSNLSARSANANMQPALGQPDQSSSLINQMDMIVQNQNQGI